MRDPTAELLQAMAADDLHPKQIIWDSRFHRFPGVGQKKGDNGWSKRSPTSVERSTGTIARS